MTQRYILGYYQLNNNMWEYKEQILDYKPSEEELIKIILPREVNLDSVTIEEEGK